MLYSDKRFAGKKPLETVWMEAHLQYKLRKNHVLLTKIPNTVNFIKKEPNVLLSSHLLLGVAIIYSMKVDYLFQDCNEIYAQLRSLFASKEDIRKFLESATSAPVQSITLPKVFKLDALDLGDENVFDIHISNLDEITLVDHPPSQTEVYATFYVNDVIDSRVPPMEEEDAPIEDLTRHLSQDYFSETQVMRDTVNDFGTNNFEETLELGGDVNPNPNTNDFLGSVRRPLSLDLQEDLPTVGVVPMENFDTPVSPRIGTMSIEIPIQSTPPPVEEHEAYPKKRKYIFDNPIVLSNKFLKDMLENTRDIVVKRKNQPTTALENWKSNKRARTDEVFLDASIFVPCKDLQAEATQANSQQPVQDGGIEIENHNIEYNLIYDNNFTDFMASPRREDEIGRGSSSQETTRLTEPRENSDIPELQRTGEDDDLSFLHKTESIGNLEKKDNTFSATAKAVAQYLKTKEEIISLIKILEGKRRKSCARMFFETLVLRSHGLIDMQQEEAYGDITLVLNSLSGAEL